MTNSLMPLKIARELSFPWKLYKSGLFLAYLKDTFDVVEKSEPQFRCIYILEAEDGNLEHGPVGSEVKCVWQVDDNGVQELAVRPKWNCRDSPFYVTPMIKFYVEANVVMVTEVYGNAMTFVKK